MVEETRMKVLGPSGIEWLWGVFRICVCICDLTTGIKLCSNLIYLCNYSFCSCVYYGILIWNVAIVLLEKHDCFPVVNSTLTNFCSSRWKTVWSGKWGATCQVTMASNSHPARAVFYYKIVHHMGCFFVVMVHVHRSLSLWRWNGQLNIHTFLNFYKLIHIRSLKISVT